MKKGSDHKGSRKMGKCNKALPHFFVDKTVKMIYIFKSEKYLTFWKEVIK